MTTMNTDITNRINTLTAEREKLLARIAEIDGMLAECKRDLATRDPAPTLPSVVIYTDGSCSGNPGPGGWGVIMQHAGKQKTLSGGDKNTTNNRMEITAVIMGLSALKIRCAVEIRTDSTYVCDAVSKGWLTKWQANGWKKADKKPVENTDLWKDLIGLLSAHEVTMTKVAGHAGNPGNELADKLATAETAKLK